jgi:hypothetical protein
MKKRFLVLSMLAAFVLAAGTARAQSVDEKIQSLEAELTQLKEQQIELKKEATAAAAAMPSFSYRPGNGLLIEAADKAWSFRTSMEGHMRMYFLDGRAHAGRTSGEIMGRRFRPEFYYCINNCLYEIETKLDLDGFGTGNAKNATGTGVGSILQRGAFHFHAENLNPFMPTVSLGMDISTSAAATLSRQGSSAIGAQSEFDMWSREVGPNTGRAGNGVTLTWNNRSLSGIGIPGRIGRFQVGRATISEGDDGLSSFKNNPGYNVYGNIQPFSATKNKWLRGLLVETGFWSCRMDLDANSNGCDRLRIRDHGAPARQALVDTGANSVGEGRYHTLQHGLTWTVGPYRLRGVYGYVAKMNKVNTGAGAGASGWLIGHDLYVWSPKGFLTGSPNIPGSILMGTAFQRNDVDCGSNLRFEGGTSSCTAASGGHRTRRILLREWGLFYFLTPRQSIGGHVLWYDASSKIGATPRRNLGANSSGEWIDAMLDWRFSF